MYKQLKPFNQSTAGRVYGYCLRNVRLGYDIPSKYSNAITAWSKTQQHKDKNFPGADVPVFYTYKTDGHINVRLKDGRCWSDGNLYASVDEYLAKHPAVAYLGWGESVNDVPVIQFVPDPPKRVFPGYRNYVPANAVGRRVYLSARCATWNVYKPGTRTVAGVLKPASNGGLSYIVRAIDSLPNRVIIQSSTFGRVSLPVDGDATFK